MRQDIGDPRQPAAGPLREHLERDFGDAALNSYRDDIRQGLDAVPAAFAEMMRGGNFGKMIVQVGEVPTG